MAEAAPSARAFLEAFFVWIYTARAHADGTVAQLIDEALAFPHQARPRRSRPRSTPSSRTRPPTACTGSTCRRSCSRAARTSARRPGSARRVAELIPGARFEVLEGEAHQPFQEAPDAFNARVAAFWEEVESVF